jgi:hypothetical protein
MTNINDVVTCSHHDCSARMLACAALVPRDWPFEGLDAVLLAKGMAVCRQHQERGVKHTTLDRVLIKIRRRLNNPFVQRRGRRRAGRHVA